MDRVTRIEENEKLFREVNERVQELQQTFRSGPDPDWVCECGDESCFERLMIGLAEYHEVRSHHDWFFVKPGHEVLDVERVVREGEGYLIVEKDGLSAS